MKFKAYYTGESNTDIHDGAFFEAADAAEANTLAKNVYGDKLLSVVKVRLIKCYHLNKDNSVCNYTWEYSGRRNKSATCPDCYKQVIIERALVL